MRHTIQTMLTIVAMLSSSVLLASQYTVPAETNSLIGHLQEQSIDDPTLITTIQKQYNVGYNAIISANPHIDPAKGFPKGATIVVPTEHLLPNQARKGIVINLPEMRMYYYPEGSNKVLTYPIGIGKVGKTIPIVATKVTRKKENPTWVPPADIREYNLEQGIVLPKVLPAGPDNPLGPYAIYMSVPTYLIHSTIFPESVGKRASFGCIRMYESDIKEFFPSVESGVPVVITNAPVKLGFDNELLFIEVHPPLVEHANEYNSSLPGIVHMIDNQVQDQPVLVNWQLVAYLAKERDGIPHEVGMPLR